MINYPNERVWKALAHPVRRRILDLLRDEPMVTGELCSEFMDKLSRFAVMKHLGILEEAGLAIVEKEGRFQRHYLNAVPIQEISRRWINRFADYSSKGLLNLKEISEKEGEQNDD